MNILAITSSYPRYAGDPTAPFVESIVRHVANRGHTIHLVLPATHGWNRPLSEAGVHYYPYRYSPRRAWTPWGYSQSLEEGVRLRRSLYLLAPVVVLSALGACHGVLRRQHIDLIHAHWVIPNGFVAAVAAKLHSVPLVVTAHGSDVSISERSRQMGRLTGWSFAHAAAVTTASRDMCERAVGLGARNSTTEVVPYGVEIATFKPGDALREEVRQQLRLEPNEVVVLAIGRLVAQKGFDYAIRAVAIAREHAPQVRLVVAGDGDALEGLVQLTSDLRLNDHVTFLGAVPRGDVPALYAAADLVVVPSVRHGGTFVEALGYVVLEAMSSGKPVIASRVGGLPENVRHEETGLLVDERDPAALAEAIVSLASDPASRNRMGRAAREAAERQPSWDDVAQRWVELYEQVMSLPRR